MLSNEPKKKKNHSDSFWDCNEFLFLKHEHQRWSFFATNDSNWMEEEKNKMKTNLRKENNAKKKNQSGWIHTKVWKAMNIIEHFLTQHKAVDFHLGSWLLIVIVYFFASFSVPLTNLIWHFYSREFSTLSHVFYSIKFQIPTDFQ